MGAARRIQGSDHEAKLERPRFGRLANLGTTQGATTPTQRAGFALAAVLAALACWQQEPRSEPPVMAGATGATGQAVVRERATV